MKTTNTQGNKSSSSKSSTANSNGSQLDNILDSFFQSNKFNSSKRMAVSHTTVCNSDKPKPTFSNRQTDSFSSQSQCTQVGSKLPNYIQSQQNNFNNKKERSFTTSAPRAAATFYDSSSEEENIIEQFKPYSASYAKEIAIQKALQIPSHSSNQNNKQGSCAQSEESNTPILSDIKRTISNPSSQSNDHLHSQQSLNRQTSASNKYSYQNGPSDVQNFSQKFSHPPSSIIENSMGKSQNNNLKISSQSGICQLSSEEKTTVGKDSVEKCIKPLKGQITGLSYLRNSSQDLSGVNQNKSSIPRFGINNNSSPIFSMNDLLNNHRNENNNGTKRDGISSIMSSSATSFGDNKSNKSSLSKIHEDEYNEDENQPNGFWEYGSHPYGQRAKINAQFNININNKDLAYQDHQSPLQPKNVFNQNQLRKQQSFDETESFSLNSNKQQNSSNQINFGTPIPNKNIYNQFMNDKKDQNVFLSAQKDEFKKYESMHQQKMLNQAIKEESNSCLSEKQQSGKISIQKLSLPMKFSSQPLNNNFFSKLNNNNNNNINNNSDDDDDDDDSDDDIEYLKKIARSSQSSQPKPKKLTVVNPQQNLKNKIGLTFFKSNSTPIPQTESNLSQIINQFKNKQEQQQSQNRKQYPNFNSQNNMSSGLTFKRQYQDLNDPEEEEEEEIKESKRAVKAVKPKRNQKKKKNNKRKGHINGKRRRLIKEDDEDYDEIQQYFEDEAKSIDDSDDDDEDDDEEDQDDLDFIDNSNNPFQYGQPIQKKRNIMGDFDYYESAHEDDEDFDYRNNQQQSKLGSKMRKKLCLEDDEDIPFMATKKEKNIFRTESKVKSKEEQKKKFKKDAKKKVVDSDESDWAKENSARKTNSASRKKSKSKKSEYDFTESDGAVDQDDDYQADSFIDDDNSNKDDDNDDDDYNDYDQQLKLNSPSNDQDDDEEDDIENKIFFNITSNQEKANKKKKKLVKGANLGEIEQFKCTICLDNPSESFGEVDCLHRFCFECIENWSKVTNQCPVCRKEFNKIVKRNFNGTVNNCKPTLVRRKKQRVNEEDYIEEAQALQDEEDRAALGDLADGNDPEVPEEPTICYKCAKSDRENLLLICDVCDENCCHTFCDEKIRQKNRVPEGRWACHFCRY